MKENKTFQTTLLYCLPIVVFIGFIFLLYVGLKNDPYALPPSLLNEPISKVQHPSLINPKEMTERYPLEDTNKKILFNKIIHEIRCSVCQFQSIADSDSKLAIDLRQTIYEQIKLEKTEKEILHYITERYGEFALYQPPFNPETYLLWLGPFFALLISLCLVARYFGKLKNRKPNKVSPC